MSSLSKFYTKRPRVTRRRKIQPPSRIPCRVRRLDGFISGIFSSRSKAKKFMGNIIKDLPPKQSSQEPKKFWIENL